jgi:hypothetical protein
VCVCARACVCVCVCVCVGWGSDIISRPYRSLPYLHTKIDFSSAIDAFSFRSSRLSHPELGMVTAGCTCIDPCSGHCVFEVPIRTNPNQWFPRIPNYVVNQFTTIVRFLLSLSQHLARTHRTEPVLSGHATYPISPPFVAWFVRGVFRHVLHYAWEKCGCKRTCQFPASLSSCRKYSMHARKDGERAMGGRMGLPFPCRMFGSGTRQG